MTSLARGSARYCTVHPYQLNIGLTHSDTVCTSTIASYTRKPNVLLLNDTMATNPTSHASGILDLVCASRKQGLEYDDDILEDEVTTQDNIPNVPLPTSLPPKQFNDTPCPPTPLPPPDGLKQFKECPAPPSCQITPLPLRETAIPRHRTAAAVRLATDITYPQLHRTKSNIAADIVTEFIIGKQDISMIYLSPDPYHEAFEEEVDIWCFDLNKHCTVGLCLAHQDGHLFLGGIAKSTPCAKIPR